MYIYIYIYIYIILYIYIYGVVQNTYRIKYHNINMQATDMIKGCCPLELIPNQPNKKIDM